MTRRNFLGTCGGVFAAAALPSFGAPPSDLFAGRGRYERLALNYIHIHIGLAEPFSVLHISDTHLTAAYSDEDARKRKIAELRTRTFGGRQEEALRDSLAWAKENADGVVHTGDLIDFQSQANYDLVRKYLPPDMMGSMGNHEFSPEMWLSQRKEVPTEAFKDPSRAALAKAYPFDIAFQATVLKGVNFVALDDVYGYVTEAQVAKFKNEAARGLPIILCMHVPFATRENNLANDKFWTVPGKTCKTLKFRAAKGKEPAEPDPVTRGFRDYLMREPLLKGILCGHMHYTFQEEFSPTARQYIVGPNFMFHGQEVLFT